ncbi:helix-turn-helix domain-containing protein [Rhodococcus sp. SORGH_AS_0303]|uniref:helix-turn-helix domain-containing protein n=1 Tax=Rhodococcus sp. SORGH_AS_0303 TaxID=3041753 RepID=UPI00358FE945
MVNQLIATVNKKTYAPLLHQLAHRPNISLMTSAVRVGTTIPEWTLADRFRKAREHAGLSQIELAQAMEVGRSAVARIEQGTATPKRPVALAWAFATGVDWDWLMGVEVPPTPACPHQGSNLGPAD